MMEYRNLRIALLGAGSVGSQVASLLLEHGDRRGTTATSAVIVFGCFDICHNLKLRK